MKPEIEIRVLDPRIHEWGLPHFRSEAAAAMDLHACLDAPLDLAPGSPAVLIPAGISFLIGDPHVVALIVPRSGFGHGGLVMGNLVGVIDPDYAGPVTLSVWNRNPPGTPPIRVAPGDRIAQLMFVPILRPSFRVVDAFTAATTRGEGGFGSTGRS